MFLPKTKEILIVMTLYHDLTDSELKKVAQKLPKEKSKESPQINAHNAFYGIMWILACDSAWRFLLENKANESKILAIVKFLKIMQIIIKQIYSYIYFCLKVYSKKIF